MRLRRGSAGSVCESPLHRATRFIHEATKQTHAAHGTSGNVPSWLPSLALTALGVVPVVSDVGGQCELVSGYAGACVPFSTHGPSATMFVDELERFITAPDLLAKTHRAARKRVEDELDLDNTIVSLHKGLCKKANPWCT